MQAPSTLATVCIEKRAIDTSPSFLNAGTAFIGQAKPFNN